MSKALDLLARRVADEPAFMAHPLAVFARSEQLDDPGLAVLLGCDVAGLTRLRLCFRPRVEPEHFLDDVAEITAHCGVTEAALIDVVRRADALIAFRGQPLYSPGLLMAARDRDTAPTDPGNDEAESS